MKIAAFLAVSLFIVFPALPRALALPREESMKGPVIRAGQRAIEVSDVRPALIWVRQQDEDEIRQAFTDAMNARKSGMDARRLADTYFLETLVRVHLRAQGKPYDGISKVEPAGQLVLAADEALEEGSVEELAGEIEEKVSQGIKGRFNDVLAKKRYMDNSVDAGRQYVLAYADYIRYLEAVNSAAAGDDTGVAAINGN